MPDRAEPNLTTLRAVRSGKINEAGALKLIENAEIQLRELVERCTWEPDNGAIERFMVCSHMRHWRYGRKRDDCS